MKKGYPSLKIFFYLFGSLILLSLLAYFYDIFVMNYRGTSISEDSITDDSFGGTEPSSGLMYEDSDAVVDKSYTDSFYVDENSTATSEEDQKVIKQGSVSMTVGDLDESTSSIRAITKTVGGFVSGLSDYGEETDRTVYLSVRVPAASFEETLEKFKDLAVDVETVSENSDDVTKQYVDLEARLENEMAYEEQLVTLLARAEDVEDILTIQRELSQVRSQIEQMEASLRYYDSQIDMSTISVTMTLDTTSLDVAGEQWRPVGIFKEAVSYLVEVLKGLGSLFIWVVVFSPLVIVPVLVVKAFRKKK